MTQADRQDGSMMWLGRLEAARSRLERVEGEAPYSEAQLERERQLREQAERRAEHLASLAVKERDARLRAEDDARTLRAEAEAARRAAWEAMQQVKRTGRRRQSRLRLPRWLTASSPSKRRSRT